MIIAHHLVWTAYGWWLPNDPRGSGSESLRNAWIAALGDLHYGRKKIQPCGRDVRRFYEKAETVLKHPLLRFEEKERSEIGLAFGEVASAHNYTCYACAIMPDHIHLLVRKHRDKGEQIMEYLKAASLERLIVKKHRPVDHPVWTGGHGWNVFLDHSEEVRRTIRYIEENPSKIGLPKQSWLFVKEYDNWPFHRAKFERTPR